MRPLPVFISIKKSNDKNANERIEKGPPEKFPSGTAGKESRRGLENKIKRKRSSFFLGIVRREFAGKTRSGERQTGVKQRIFVSQKKHILPSAATSLQPFR